MQFASPECEVCWISNHLAVVLLAQQQGILWKPYIVAYPNSDIAELSLENSKLRFTRLHILALLEDDVARQVDIKKVLLSMLSLQVAKRVEAEASVVDFVRPWDFLGHRSTDDVGASLLGQSTEHVIGLATLLRRFFVLKHVVLCVGGREHLRKHNHLSTVTFCFSYHLTRSL